MRLTAFSVGDFQSYGDPRSITIDPKLTLVAGRNNVGKSALLRALRVPVEQQEGAGPNFAISYTWEMSADELLGLALLPSDTSPEFTEWARQRETHTVKVTLRRRSDADTPGQTVHGNELYVSEFELPNEGKRATGGPGATPQWEAGGWGGNAYMDFLLRIADLRTRTSFITPRRIQQGPWGLVQTGTLEPDARNLTEVVLHLYMNSPTRKFQALRDFMVAAFPEIQTLTVMEVAGQPHQGQLGVVYENLEHPVPMLQCGTGVEQLLALAVGLLTAPAERLFLIDEPQAYLHPHAERSLLELLEANPQHQYVIATHSAYLLGTRPLSDARLLTFENGVTRVTEFPSATDLLSELGLTAADLWLAENVLWVEGRSEVEAVRVAAGELGRDVRVRPMPESASRFSSASPRQAQATYRFCSEVMEAIAPLPVRMLFLFDSDEKSAEHRQRIEEESRGNARFLEGRELENLFLDLDLLTMALSERSALLGWEAPSKEEVGEALANLLASQEDRRLFPRPLIDGEDATQWVRGSEVLSRMFWEFTTSEYDKVSDGKWLAELAAEHNPSLLQPLRTVLEELVGAAEGV
jgi:predicted ATPase